MCGVVVESGQGRRVEAGLHSIECITYRRTHPLCTGTLCSFSPSSCHSLKRGFGIVSGRNDRTGQHPGWYLFWKPCAGGAQLWVGHSLLCQVKMHGVRSVSGVLMFSKGSGTCDRRYDSKFAEDDSRLSGGALQIFSSCGLRQYFSLVTYVCRRSLQLARLSLPISLLVFSNPMYSSRFEAV